MWSYALPLLTALLGLLYLAKDWGAHRTTWRRTAVMMLIIASGFGGAINNYYRDKASNRQHAEDQARIEGLQKSVETANKNQEVNTQKFILAFRDLGEQVANLKTQVATTDLRQRANELEKQLQATQKALEPGPKAKLVFTFEKPDLSKPGPPVNEISARPENGVVTVSFTTINPTEVEAQDVDITLHICDPCKFEKEPEGFQHPKGQRENQRLFTVARMHPRSVLPLMNAQIRVPSDLNAFQIAILNAFQIAMLP